MTTQQVIKKTEEIVIRGDLRLGNKEYRKNLSVENKKLLVDRMLRIAIKIQLGMI